MLRQVRDQQTDDDDDGHNEVYEARVAQVATLILEIIHYKESLV